MKMIYRFIFNYDTCFVLGTTASSTTTPTTQTTPQGLGSLPGQPGQVNLPQNVIQGIVQQIVRQTG